MSQKTEPKFLIIGAVSSILIACLCSRTLSVKGCKSDKMYCFMGADPLKIILYLLWLLVQIVKSAVYVSRIALAGQVKTDMSVAYFKADYDSPFARSMLANSITLTPGTITIDITDDGVYSVHTLTGELREGLLDGSMQNKVAWAFGETIDFRVIDREEAPVEAKPADQSYAPKSYRVHVSERSAGS